MRLRRLRRISPKHQADNRAEASACLRRSACPPQGFWRRGFAQAGISTEVRVTRVLEKIANSLNKWFIWIGGSALLCMIGIACANMLLRPLGSPLRGAYELVGFLGAMTVAFALGYAQMTRAHIAVDILVTRYSKKTSKTMNAISSFLSGVFFILVAWQVFVFGTTIWKRGETSETLRIIYHPFVYAVAICCLVLAFVLFIDLLKSLATEKGKDR
jgi:TRAP-type C4-dicarboxylate transport system permease small subunit